MGTTGHLAVAARARQLGVRAALDGPRPSLAVVAAGGGRRTRALAHSRTPPLRQTGLNAETKRIAEKRREEELPATLCESLRLGVKSSQPASKSGYSSSATKQREALCVLRPCRESPGFTDTASATARCRHAGGRVAGGHPSPGETPGGRPCAWSRLAPRAAAPARRRSTPSCTRS